MRFIESIAENGTFSKKFQSFRKELQYMGNAVFIEDMRVCVQPSKSRLKAI